MLNQIRAVNLIDNCDLAHALHRLVVDLIRNGRLFAEDVANTTVAHNALRIFFLHMLREVSIERCVARADNSTHLAGNQHVNVIVWLARLEKLVTLRYTFFDKEDLELFNAAAAGNAKHRPIPHEEVNLHFAIGVHVLV
jgi:hypothetical protein